MRKKRILTVLLVSIALAALLAGCAEEEIGPAAPLVPAQTDEQPPASEPDESTVPEEPESEEEPEAQHIPYCVPYTSVCGAHAG